MDMECISLLMRRIGKPMQSIDSLMKRLETPFRKTDILLGLSLLALSLFLRFRDWDLTLPYFISDGAFETRAALGMLQAGDFNPHYFKCGGFPLYLLSGIYFVYLKIFYWFSGLADPFRNFLTSFSVEDNNYALFYLAKYATLFFGLGVIPLIFRCTDIIWERRSAWLAAFFAAVSPTLVFSSQAINVDVFSLFFLCSTFYFSLKIWQSGQFKFYLLAGAAAGLTIACKYNFLVAVMVLGADFLLRRKRGEKLTAGTGKLFVSLYLAVLVFFITSPYTILSFREFTNYFRDLFSVQGATYQKATEGWFRWGLASLGGQLTIILPLLSGPLYVGAGLGVWWFFRKREELLLLGIFPLVYLFVSGLSTQVVAPSFSLPVLPFVLILGSAFCTHALQDSRRAIRYVSGVLVVLTLAFSLSDLWIPHYRYPFIVHRDFGQWVEKNVNPGQKIFITWTLFPKTSRFWSGRASLLDSPGDLTEEKIRQGLFDYVEIFNSRYAVAKEGGGGAQYQLKLFDVDRYREISRRMQRGEFGYREAAHFGIPRFWGYILGVVYPWYGREMEYLVYEKIKPGK